MYTKVISSKRLLYNINCVCNLVLNSVKRRKFHRYNREQMCGRSRYTWAFRSVISGFPTTALSGLETSTFCVRRKEEGALTQITHLLYAIQIFGCHKIHYGIICCRNSLPAIQCTSSSSMGIFFPSLGSSYIFYYFRLFT